MLASISSKSKFWKQSLQLVLRFLSWCCISKCILNFPWLSSFQWHIGWLKSLRSLCYDPATKCHHIDLEMNIKLTDFWHLQNKSWEMRPGEIRTFQAISMDNILTLQYFHLERFYCTIRACSHTWRWLARWPRPYRSRTPATGQHLIREWEEDGSSLLSKWPN